MVRLLRGSALLFILLFPVFLLAQAPTITSLSPTSGAVGAPVTITGTNFGSAQGTSTVKFNGTSATPTYWTTTTIQVPVPTGATTGNVVVTVGGQASNGVSFTVSSGSAPVLTSLTPAYGTIGTVVTIAGNNFGATQGTNTVKFHNTTASPTSWSNTSIVVADPSGATDGNVVVTVNAVASNGIWFPGPKITSLSPTSGAVGTSVTITGTNFGSTQGTGFVAFNGTVASPTWGNNTITVPVPAGATTGNVVVTANGADSNGVSFTVTGGSAPSITSLSPTSGAVGTSVTITGTSFGATQGTSTVTFNGTAATTTSWSATSIVAPVPSGATTGNVVVTVGGQASNGVSFTVAPKITSLSPTSGAVGTSVTITGANFGATQGTSTVKFNGTTATPTSWSATSIAVPVPTGATTGNVVVTVGGVASNGVSFTVGSQGSSNLQISSPADGSVASPGQTISVTVSDPNNVAYSQVAVLGEPVGISSVATSVPAQFSLSIPANISCQRYTLVAAATTVSGQDVTSPEITIDVERSDSPTSLSTLMPSVTLDNLGETFPVTILATFSDGSVLEVTESSNLVYSSSNSNVVSVDAMGILTALAVGNVTVTATYAGNVQISIPIVVPSQALDPSPSSLNFGNKILGTNNTKQIVLTNATLAPMQILGVTITGDYTETDNCISSSPIAPGSTCTVNVTFTPTMLGVRNGSLRVSQDFSGAVGVSLSGTGQ